MMYIAARTEKRGPAYAVPQFQRTVLENYLTAANVLCVESACATAARNKAAEYCVITLRLLCSLSGSVAIPRSISEHSDCSRDTKGDYTGALVTRAKSLTNGIMGRSSAPAVSWPARIY